MSCGDDNLKWYTNERTSSDATRNGHLTCTEKYSFDFYRNVSVIIGRSIVHILSTPYSSSFALPNAATSISYNQPIAIDQSTAGRTHQDRFFILKILCKETLDHQHQWRQYQYFGWIKCLRFGNECVKWLNAFLWAMLQCRWKPCSEFEKCYRLEKRIFVYVILLKSIWNLT